MSEHPASDCIVVYGSSDDLIQIEGALCLEFDYSESNEGDLLAFSNGVVLRIRYGASGVWRITPAACLDQVTINSAPENDSDNYSDRATIHGTVAWVVHGSEIAWASS